MKLIFLVFTIIFPLFSSFLPSESFQDFLDFTELGSQTHSGQAFTPISLDEFEFRITALMLREVKHERPVAIGNDKLGNIENAFRFNKMYRCLFGKNLAFSTKTLFHLMRIKLRQCERILSLEEISIKKPLNNLQELRLIMQDLMAVGGNIMCHREVQNVEKRIDPIIDRILEQYRRVKEDLLENLLSFLLNHIDKFFGRYYDETTQKFPNPAEFETPVKIIRRYWEANFQDLEYFDTTAELIKRGMRKVFAGRYGNEENAVIWGKFFGKFCYEFFKLKHILINESPFISIKKESSSFYHILRILMEKLEEFYLKGLGNADNENVFRISRHFLDVASSAFLVSSVWHIFFQENEYIMNEIPTEFNFKDDFMKIYAVSGQADINYRTCSEINEMEEILLVSQRITDSLNEVGFTYDADLVNNLLDYRPALDSIYSGVCSAESEMCLDVMFDEKRLPSFAKVLLKVDPSFNSRLVKLRKFGPITNIGISQSEFEENYYIKMGYVAPYQSNDTSLMLWICRSCGGDYGISEITFQKGKLQDFNTVMPDPTCALNIFQVYADVVVLVERKLINSYVLSPQESGQEKQRFLSNMVWDDDYNSSAIWENMGYFNSRTGFYLLFNYWNVIHEDWMLDDYPKIFSPKWRIEKKYFCVITVGNFKCKRELIQKFRLELNYEDSFDEYALWTFRSEDANLTVDAIQEKIKGSNCELLNVFETKPNGNFVLIDEKNKAGLLKDTQNGDRRSANLYFERVPQKTLYICYQWLYPVDETTELDLSLISLQTVKESLRMRYKDKLIFYSEILCDPTSRRFCSFIDDDYLKKRNYLDVHIVGTTAGFPSLASDLNYVKEANPTSTSKCQPLALKIPSLLALDIPGTEAFLHDFLSLFQSFAESQCEVSRVFPLQIPCPDRLKYIKQVNDFGLEYLCSEVSSQVYRNLTAEERIPILRDLFLNVKVSQTPQDKQGFSLEMMKQVNYYFPAYWVRFPVKKFTNKKNQIYYFIATLFIRINVHHYNFIGISDTYSAASCIDLNANYDRYVSTNQSSFDRDSFLFKHEQAFFNSVKPRKLEFYQGKYNLGSVETNNWRIFLKKTQCEHARLWIPITWRGDGARSCNNIFSVKSLKVLPNRGIQETCDGTKLPIYNVYYMEVLAYSDPSSPEFVEPTPLELEIARKNGYIPYGNKLQTYSVIEGYHTKIRLWVKPKAKINSLRKVSCKGTEEDVPVVPPGPPGPPPFGPEKDIYSRVTVLSNERQKFYNQY